MHATLMRIVLSQLRHFTWLHLLAMNHIVQTMFVSISL